MTGNTETTTPVNGTPDSVVQEPEVQRADATESPTARPVERPSDDVQCVDVTPPIGEVDDSALDELDKVESALKIYAHKIYARLRDELSRGKSTDNWLLRQLRENGWWVRAKEAPDVMAGLHADSDPSGWPDPFYLRDIFVWMPDERWGEMRISSRIHRRKNAMLKARGRGRRGEERSRTTSEQA